MSRTARLAAIFLASATACALLPGPASAQYFGSNKVQYETFDFRILQTKHFDIYYYPQEQEGTLYAARLAERWYARYAEMLRHELRDRQPLILYASHPDFGQTNLVEGSLGEGTGGLTESDKRRIVMPFGVGLGETSHVLAHELVHAFQYDLARRGNGGILEMPLWFIEGMAEYLSLGRDDGLTAMWMRDIVRQGHLPSIKELDQPRFFPYRYGQALWSYLAARFGDDVVRKLLTARGDTVAGRLKAVTGLDEAQLTKDWHDSLRASFPPAAADAAKERGAPPLHRLVASAHGGHLNVAPSLSPDGSSVTFLSERDRFSVDLYLADARTGAIRRKIVSTATDPHFDSLQFIESAGAWDPSGRRFVFAAVTAGKPVLVILDPSTGTTESEIRFDDLGQVFHPTWSPDGQRLAFCGLKSGLSDIYVYDLASRKTDRLTFDPYTDVQPAWSPDGRQIAFVTDRFSTDLPSLRFGAYQVALVDVATGEIRQAPGFPGVRSVDPQWAPDGRSLYFVADPARIPNVYRVDLATGGLYQVTDVPIGVSGITQLSPALSVARNRTKLAFSLYDAGNYEIYDLSAPEVVLGRPVHAVATLAARSTWPAGAAGDLLPGPPVEPHGPQADKTPAAHASSFSPPAEAPRAAADAPAARAARDDAGRQPGGLAPGRSAAPGPRADETESDGRAAAPRGGAAASDLTVKRYRRSLSLDGMGQPYFSAGGGEFGSFFRAGMSFSLGDMLRDQVVDAAVQVGRHAEDFAGRAIYLNRRSRWNWGAEVEYLPLVFAQSDVSLAPDTGLVSTRIDYLRQVERGVSGLAYFPFSRADRLELAAGFRGLTFARQLQTQVLALGTGSTVSDTTTDLPGARPVNLFEASVAFVHDTTVLGPTSPILGSRYRLELSPSLGSLAFATVLADYRRYVVPVKPFTFAVRARYLGRHGRDAADSRLLPLVLSLRDDVRGYDLGTLLGDPCTADEMLRGCSALGRLNDSRLLVANAEIRFPLKGLFTRSFDYGPLPLEGLVFADAGNLWRQVAGPDGAPPAWQQNLLRSVGAGVRVNVGGVVFEFDAVRRFDTPARGWTFFFNLLPGF